MKKLVLLALAFVMCGCCNQYVTDYGIVECVEINKGGCRDRGTYIVTISNDFNAHWECKVYLYTNKLYQVGDTIYVKNKN